MTTPHIHLASKSPRRQELLRQLGIDFDLLKLREAAGRERDVIEGARDAEPPLHYVERMARTKVAAGWQRMRQRLLPEWPVLSADTEVVLDGVIFGNPADAADAARMLKVLSGQTHQVMTAVAVRLGERTEVKCRYRTLLSACSRRRKSSTTSPRVNRPTKPAPMRSRARPRHS